MSDLKLTPARLALLRAVERGEVAWYRNFGHEPSSYDWDQPGHRRRVVTAAAEKLFAAGLIAMGRTSSPSYYASRPVVVTRAGAELLAAQAAGDDGGVP
jgi:hypothetical protein